MTGVLMKVKELNHKYPVLRGMASYAVIWPCSCITQEYIEHGKNIANANWGRAARFGFFGAFFMAPVFYGWMKYTSPFFKGKNLKTALTRAAIEQVSYSPLALAYFLYGMSLLEMKSPKQSWEELKIKFWPTYKISAVYWPSVQTLNFHFVSEPNRIIFVSIASFIWTVFLAHVKASKTKFDAQFYDVSTMKVENPEKEERKPVDLEHKKDEMIHKKDETIHKKKEEP